VPLLLATAACSAPRAIPSEIVTALADTPSSGGIRILLEDKKFAQWIIAVEPNSLPAPVQRSAEAVLQGGELSFVGQVHGGPEEAYLLEKRYPQLAEQHMRKAIIAADGQVILRSHSIPRRELPREVGAALQAKGDLETLEFIEAANESYYRAVFLGDRGQRQALELDVRGEEHGLFRILVIEASLARQP